MVPLSANTGLLWERATEAREGVTCLLSSEAEPGWESEPLELDGLRDRAEREDFFDDRAFLGGEAEGLLGFELRPLEDVWDAERWSREDR